MSYRFFILKANVTATKDATIAGFEISDYNTSKVSQIKWNNYSYDK